MTGSKPGRSVSPDGEADRLSGAELRVWLDWLGLDARAASRVLGVRHDTVRRWITGREPVPVRVGEEMETIDAWTAQAVGDVVGALAGVRDPGVVIYRTDEALWAAREGFEPYPASWWRMVIARATAEVPGVDVAYSDEAQQAREQPG